MRFLNELNEPSIPMKKNVMKKIVGFIEPYDKQISKKRYLGF